MSAPSESDLAVQTLRFVPPPLQLTPELEWVLLRAFGPVDLCARASVDAEAAWALAARLDLASRIGARSPAEVLAAETGESVATRFRDAYHSTVWSNLLLVGVAGEIAGVAATAGIEVVFLKSVALMLSGVTPIGTRNAGDVDVLVSNSELPRLCSALRDHGFSIGTDGRKQHQIMPSFHSSGAMVEIHRSLKGLRAGGRRWLTAEDLLPGSRSFEIVGLPGGCLVPALSFVVAHLMVHAIVQHGAHPGSYPGLRLIADLADVSQFDSRPLDARRDEVVARACGPLRRQEVISALRLTQALTTGTPALADVAGDPDLGWWLRHVVAVLDDHDYREYLRLPGIVWDEVDSPRGLRWTRKVWSSLTLSRREMEQRYGPLDNPVKRALFRAWRPFDLVLRVIRYLRKHARYRWDRGGR